MDTELAAFQRWMFGAITHPEGPAAGVSSGENPHWALDRLCLPSKQLTAEARVRIYSDMYFLRLCEVLQEDFPALAAHLGPDVSARVFREFVVAHPSSHFSLSGLGAGLADHVAGDESLRHRAFAVELARLERSLQEVFDGPRSEPIGVDALLALAPDDWAGAHFDLAPTVQLHAFEYPTSTWYQAWREAKTAPPAPERDATHLAVHRRDYVVWRTPLSGFHFHILSGLAEGLALGAALEAAVVASPPTETDGAGLQEAFQEWAGSGFFVGVHSANGTD